MTLFSTRSIQDKLEAIGSEVVDPDEEIYDLFSRDLPQSNLGMIDDKATTLQVEVAGHPYEIRQSPGLLTSSNAEGTTGAALWKISPIVAEWLADKNGVVWTNEILHPAATIIELGCGVTGLIGLVMTKLISTYVLTDQGSVLKLLQDNVRINSPTLANQKTTKHSNKKQSSVKIVQSNLLIAELNWEFDAASALDGVLAQSQAADVILVCDCVFNDFLIEPLVRTCEKLCSMAPHKRTVLLIAQQLRSDEVCSAFFERLLHSFRVWRCSDNNLPVPLRSDTGFAVHLAILR